MVPYNRVIALDKHLKEFRYDIENAAIKLFLDIRKPYITPSKAPKPWHFEHHIHCFAELFLCLEGEAYIEFSDSIVAIKKNECIIIPEGTEHHRLWSGTDFYNCYPIVMICDSNDIGYRTDMYTHINRFLQNRLILKNCEELCKAAEKMHTSTAEADIFSAGLKFIGELGLLKLPTDEKNSHRDEKNNSRLTELNHIINTHFADEVTCEAIAEKMFLSRRQLNRFTEKYYGMTLNAMIKSRRLSVAGKLLIDGDMDIEDIALAVGYKSKSAFHSLFKKFYGLTPSQYRKTHKFSL